MDSRIRRIVLDKIDETLSSQAELSLIQHTLAKGIKSSADFAIGLVIGRIYNSFHYQTRRVLKRNATPDEFNEFVQLLVHELSRIEKSIKQ